MANPPPLGVSSGLLGDGPAGVDLAVPLGSDDAGFDVAPGRWLVVDGTGLGDGTAAHAPTMRATAVSASVDDRR